MHNIKPLPQNPFSLYDFLGYLIPGIIFTGSIIFIDLYVFDNFCGLNCLFDNLKEISKESSSITFSETTISIFYIIFFFTSMYLIGHIIGILSSTFIEKLYYVKKFGYPGNCILPNKESEFNNESCVIKLFLTPVSIFYYFIIKLFFVSIKKYFNDLFSETEKSLINKKLIKIMHDLTFSENKTKVRAKNLQKKEYSFLTIYHYVIEVECPHLIKINNYVAIYGFFRNICFSFVICFWFSLVVTMIHIHEYSKTTIVVPFLFSLLSIVTFVGFDKFYKRFAKEVLYAALVNKE